MCGQVLSLRQKVTRPGRPRSTPGYCISLLLGLSLGLPGQASAQSAATDMSTSDLLDLSLEQLADLEISSASKRPEKLTAVAASVFVITAQDIARSGATSLPEVLRLAPHLQVARIDANSYAISARGFNSSTANKLQVLIDGRIVYTPLFSGVFWDAQSVMLEDIERIEVISGPAATIWGSNAVNGVINVITRPAAATQGNLIVAGTGNLEHNLSARHGGTLSGGGDYRIYARAFEIEETERENGSGAGDSWTKGQIGFRVDLLDAGKLTIQGDIYQGDEDQLSAGAGEIRGFNLLTRLQHDLTGDSQVQLLAYYDRTERDQPGTFAETLDTVNLEFQHHLRLAEEHDVIWGVNYRRVWDDVTNTAALAFLPAKKTLHWGGLFLQDEIHLHKDWRLTLGARIEVNTYSGMEVMPNARLAWNISPDDLLWASLARSVRTPSRLDRELFVPGTGPLLVGGPDFDSEVANSIEFGYRGLVSHNLSYSITAFHHQYDNLRTVEPIAGGQFVIGNRLEATTSGLEFWGDYQASKRWRLSAGGILLRESLDLEAGSGDLNGGQSEAQDPEVQWSLRSSLDLGAAYTIDTSLRGVGKLTTPDVPAYTELDVHLSWQPAPGSRLSVAARNLLQSSHAEFGPEATRSVVERSVYVQWRQSF